MSDFKVNILTFFLVLECGQEHHKNNGITSGQIGPRVPSGLILENWGTFVIVFTSRALYFDLPALFQRLIDEILITLQTDIGPLPGRYTMRQSQLIFKIRIYQRLKQLLSSYGLKERPNGLGSNCSNSEICKSRFIKYVSFLRKMNMLYPMVFASEDYLAQRPGMFLYIIDICR